MIDTQGSEWISEDGEMKKDKRAHLLTVCAKESALIAYRKHSLLKCLVFCHVIG